MELGKENKMSRGYTDAVDSLRLSTQVFSSISAITALHPIIALLLFWGSITTVKRANKDRV